MGIRIDDNSDHQSAHTINAWLAEHGPAWAERVRAQYGSGAEDVLEMLGVAS